VRRRFPARLAAALAPAAVAAVVAAIVAAKAPPGQAQEPTVAYGAGEGAAAQLATELCASCHGDDLRGGRASSLLDDTWVHGGSDTDLAESIREGRPGTLMPPFKALLDERQVRSLVVLIRELAEKARVETAGAPAPIDAVRASERHAFRIEAVADGLDTPWGFEFLPDGRILLTERPGRLRILTPGQGLGAPIRGTPRVWERQDGGLLDVALHPDYSRNGWVYLSYATPGERGKSATAIVRGRIRDGAWVDQQLVYEPKPADYGPANDHYGIRLLFDRASYLYYSIGDRGQPDDAQSLASPHGKIHRVRDDGSAPPDNPFVGRDGALATIWSYGHRNPQGLAFHPATRELWASEHGPRGGDELNRILRGRNYGWPVVTHGINYDGTPISPLTEKEGMASPVAEWTPSLAVCAVAFYTGDRFPGWKGSLLVTGLVGKQLRRLELEGGRVTHQELLFRGLGRVRDVAEGPDGYLYVALNQPGRLVRLVPAAGEAAAAAASPAAERFFSEADYERVEKIDLHAHVHARDGAFVERARADRFRFVNIATWNADPDELKMRHETVFAQREAHPDRVAAVVSFPLEGWDEAGWAERTIQYLDAAFARGAAGVKLWKNIGMESRDRRGRIVMIDDPRFEAVFDYLEVLRVPVIAHLGEPRECWLPLEQMVMHKGYFQAHPEYHMFLHPELPSYADQLTARDRLLERHPRLRFAGAHLASLEWNVGALAAFLDRFPDAIVETAARVRDLQLQSSRDRERVRDFLIRYADRVAYGTDLSVRPTAATDEAIAAARERWRADWRYFATDLPVAVRQLEQPVQGLQLPREVVEKLFRANAERFLGDAWQQPR